MTILRTNRKDDLELYGQDEKDWFCTVEFLPTDDSEARMLALDIMYLFRLRTSNEHPLSRTRRRSRRQRLRTPILLFDV